MTELPEIVALFPDLDRAELLRWIDQRWVRPDRINDEVWVFQAVDVARVRLVYDLRHDLETPEALVPMVLDLLDQIYELRAVNRAMTAGHQENTQLVPRDGYRLEWE